MLLELRNTTEENINKLMAFAKQNDLQLSLVDDDGVDYHLPGKPLTPEQLETLIEDSRKSGTISMEDAHELIRKKLHADKVQ